MGRFSFTRFYFPNNKIAQEPGFWAKFEGCDTDTLVYAYAIYLYNMYVSTAAYREDMPAALTVDYVGALDGFSKCANGFDVTEASSFYTKHRKEIQTILKDFFAKRSLPAYALQDSANERREKAFLNILAHSFSLEKKYPTYKASNNTRLQGRMKESEISLLKNFLQRALAKGSRKVISYEQRQVLGPQLDTPIAHMRVKTHTICRSANEECAACNYLLGKEMCADISAKHRNWGLVRLYRVTARPLRGELKTASGTSRFTLANGTKAVPWSYHTAMLVILNLDGEYAPYIVDKFLAGIEPMAPQKWFSKFSLPQTVFMIEPFQRNEVAEQRIRDK